MSKRSGANNVQSPEDKTFTAEAWCQAVADDIAVSRKKVVARYDGMVRECMGEARIARKFEAVWTLPVSPNMAVVDEVCVDLETRGFTTKVSNNANGNRSTVSVGWKP